MVKDKDYYLVTTLTDGAVYDTPFDRERITLLREYSLASVQQGLYKGYLGGGRTSR